MPKRKEGVVLCLDPGTHEMGVAVLEGQDLVDYRVVTFRSAKSARELLNQADKRMKELLADYEPSLVVIEKPFFSKTRRSALLVFLVQELRARVLAGNLRLVELSPIRVREVLLKNPRATKRDIAGLVASRYPQLTQYLSFESHWKEKYWSHVFDAVALGLAAEDKSQS